MIQPTRQKNEYKPDNGDVLLGSKYIAGKTTQETIGGRGYLFLGRLSGNPWKALQKLGIDFHHVQATMQYRCPFMEDGKENVYYWWVPQLVVYQKPEQLRKDDLLRSCFDYLFDKDFWKSMIPEPLSHGAGKIQQAFLGHGYTYGTLPHDGSGKIVPMSIETNQPKVIVVGYGWVWYNK